MIHVVFNEADIDALKKAIDLDDTLAGAVIQIIDDLAVGPLLNIYSEEGIAARKTWWRDVLAGGDYDGLADKKDKDDAKTVADLFNRLNADAEELLWIWAAPNKHDVCGYYWLMSQLKPYQGRIFILYLNSRIRSASTSALLPPKNDPYI